MAEMADLEPLHVVLRGFNHQWDNRQFIYLQIILKNINHNLWHLGVQIIQFQPAVSQEKSLVDTAGRPHPDGCHEHLEGSQILSIYKQSYWIKIQGSKFSKSEAELFWGEDEASRGRWWARVPGACCVGFESKHSSVSSSPAAFHRHSTQGSGIRRIWPA